MIRLMFDSDDLAALPNSAAFLAAYTDAVPDLPALQAAHPHSEILLIDRGLGDPGTRATIADVEPGALAIADIPRWYDEHRQAGREFLTIYTDRNDLNAAIASLAGRPAFHWVATLDGTVHVPGFPPLQGPALVQILGADQLGIHADLSLVLRDDWHPVPPAREPAAVAADLAMAQTWNQDVARALARLQRDLLLPP